MESIFCSTSGCKAKRIASSEHCYNHTQDVVLTLDRNAVFHHGEMLRCYEESRRLSEALRTARDEDIPRARVRVIPAGVSGKDKPEDQSKKIAMKAQYDAINSILGTP